MGLLVLCATPSCGGSPPTRSRANAPPPSFAEYTVTGNTDGSALVTGTFRNVASELSLWMIDEVSSLTIEGGFTRGADTRIFAQACKATCTFRYTLAPKATRVVESSKLLLLPGNAPRAASVHLRGAVVSGLLGSGEERELVFAKTREGAPFAFGPLRAKTLRPGLEFVVLAPSEFKDAAVFDAFDAWVDEAYRGVSALYGRAPVANAHVFFEPVAGRDRPLFGRALTLSGAAVTLLVGTEASAKTLREDWTLVHELLHLGFPTVIGGRYFMEGLSTYFEPIVRARLHTYSANQAWGELYRGMADVAETPPLDVRRGIDATYWGGAALMLLCDVELRRRTGRSLETLLGQNVLRGRTSADELTVEAILREMDGPDGGQGVLTEIFQRHAKGAVPFPLAALFESLGIGKDGIVNPGAPLAAVRQSIMNAP